MPSHYDMTLIDYDKEKASTGVWSTTVTAANFTAQIAAAIAYRDAVLGISLGGLVSEQLLAFLAEVTPVLPTNQFAQTGTRWLVRAKDVAMGRAVTFKIPVANLALVSPGTEVLDILTGPGATFKTAAEAFVKSPIGNAIQIVEVVNA